MKLLFVSMVCFLQSTCLFSQWYLAESDTVNIDRHFVEFQYPVVNKMASKDADKYVVFGVHVVSYIVVDRNGTVDSILNTPLYGVGNELPETHPIWKELDDGIRLASHSWKFSALKYDTLGLPDSLKEKARSGDLMPPHAGRQYHLIVWMYQPFFDEFVFDKMYALPVIDEVIGPLKDSRFLQKKDE